MDERKVPCLVRDITGKIGITLEKGAGSYFGNPKWQCDDITCPIRTRSIPGEVGAACHPLSVRLRTVNGIHGVFDCEGGGKAGDIEY